MRAPETSSLTAAISPRALAGVKLARGGSYNRDQPKSSRPADVSSLKRTTTAAGAGCQVDAVQLSHRPSHGRDGFQTFLEIRPFSSCRTAFLNRVRKFDSCRGHLNPVWPRASQTGSEAVRTSR